MTITQTPQHTPQVGDVFGPVLAAVQAQLCGLVDVPAWSLDDKRLGDRFAQALGLKASVDELVARFAAQIDDRDLARPAGASSTRAHLMATYRLSAGEAGRVLSTARAMSVKAEPTRQALARGQVTGEQAVVVASAVNRLSADVDPARVASAG